MTTSTFISCIINLNISPDDDSEPKHLGEYIKENNIIYIYIIMLTSEYFWNSISTL